MEEAETYAMYCDERHRAIEWEYREVDKSECRQFVTCILTIVASVAILFCAGDSFGLCVSSIFTSVTSLIALHLSSVLSQQGMVFYRDELIGPTMQVDEENKRLFDTKRSMITIANGVSSCLAIASLILLALRCAQEII